MQQGRVKSSHSVSKVQPSSMTSRSGSAADGEVSDLTLGLQTPLPPPAGQDAPVGAPEVGIA